MKKRIWIINEYAGSPYHGIEYRSYYLSKELIKLNYEVVIVSSNYSHLFKKTSKAGFENIDGIKYYWINTINYKDSKSFLRILKWFIFTFKLFFVLAKLEKPDYIIVSPMQTMPVIPALLYSKLRKAKLIFEVKDIWPKSIIDLGGLSPTNPFIKILHFCEKLAIKKSDAVVSSLQNYDEHIKELGIDKDFNWICNGFDEDILNHIEPLANEITNKISKDSFIVGYTGTVGIANALDYFLESMTYLKDIDVKLIIVGDGKEKESLMTRFSNNKNIVFVGRINKNQVLSAINLFDVCFIGWHDKSLYDYGISPNKIFDYMVSEKPILHSYSGKADIVQLANCGITVKAEKPKEIARGIRELYEMNELDREVYGKNAKSFLLENFTYKKLAEKYNKILINQV